MTTAAQARVATARDGARRQLEGLPGGRGLNIAHEAVDRHFLPGHGDATALRCLEDPDPVLLFEHSSLYNMGGSLALTPGTWTSSGPPYDGRGATSPW